MLIPLAQVNDLVSEREGRAREATRQIAERWGASQLVGAPVPSFRCAGRWFRTKRSRLSRSMNSCSPIVPRSVRRSRRSCARYGIYETAVYTADLKVEGRFRASDIAALAAPGIEPQWQRAELRVPVADVRGIRRVSSPAFRRWRARVRARHERRRLCFRDQRARAAGSRNARRADRVLVHDDACGHRALRGVAARTRDRSARAGTWPDPGFDGAFLPATRRVDASGFEAEWQVLDLNRALAQRWREGENVDNALRSSAFGITLTQPAGSYQQNVRAGKYGVLFIALTFIAFFLFEVLHGLRVHAVQYLLVGLALATFYVVLLAVSEQIGFALAYALAAAAVVAMVGGYAGVRARATARGTHARRAARADLCAALRARRQRGLPRCSWARSHCSRRSLRSCTSRDA